MSTDTPATLPADVVPLLTALAGACSGTLAESFEELLDEVLGELSSSSIDAVLVGNETDDEFDERVEVEQVRLRTLLEPFGEMFAVAPAGQTWSLFVPCGEWSGDGLDTTGAIYIVGEDGSVEHATWAEVRNDPRFWLAPGATLFGRCWENADEFPLSFDAESWEGTLHDYNFGGDWVVREDNTEYSFDLSEVSLRYRTPLDIDPTRVGDWLSVDAGGTSMTSGDIGFTVSMDSNGGFWSYEWGCRHIFIGRSSSDGGPEDALSTASVNADGADLYGNSVAEITSDVFGPAAMWAVVEEILGEDPDPDALDELEVECVGFVGSARELAVKLGITEDDDEDDEDEEDAATGDELADEAQ